MEHTKFNKSFLSLVRLGVGHTPQVIFQPTNWKEIEFFANRHGLLAIVVDGIEKLPSGSRPPQELLLEWIGEVLQDYEYRYEQYCKAIAELAGFYNPRGFKMMVLKGYACSLDWTMPSHRPCGDIDIWLFGKQKEADATITKEKGIKIDKSHHHHTVLQTQRDSFREHCINTKGGKGMHGNNIFATRKAAGSTFGQDYGRS